MRLFIIFLSHMCTSELWQKQQIVPSSTFSTYSKYGAFIGKQNQSIYIIGGGSKFSDLLEYNISSQSFVSHPNSYKFKYQVTQSSVQIGNELFMLAWFYKNIIKLNMYTLNIETVTMFPGLAEQYRCMTNFGSHLIIIGGVVSGNWDGYANMYVFDLIHRKWSNGTSLPFARFSHSCNMFNQKIYVFGGYTWDTGISNDILLLEIADPNNCCYGQWVKLNATLTTATSVQRSLVIGTQIYIIGGKRDGAHSSITLSKVDIFETQTNQVYAYSNMIAPRFGHAAIEINNVIYVFGGHRNDRTYFEYNVLPTQSPTTSPSKTPTTITYYPTYNPSDYPTYNPSDYPTSSTNTDIIMTSVNIDGNDTEKTQDHSSSSVLTALIIVFSVLILILSGAIFWQRKTTSSKVDTVEAKEKQVGDDDNDVVEMVNTEGNDIITKGNSSLVMSDSDDENQMINIPATETTCNYDQHENDSDMNESEQMQVNTWLDSIGLNEYYATFVSNGFDSLNMVKEINDKDDLVDIGITLKAHQLKIINHIQKLKYTNTITTTTTTATTATINTTK